MGLGCSDQAKEKSVLQYLTPMPEIYTVRLLDT